MERKRCVDLKSFSWKYLVSDLSDNCIPSHLQMRERCVSSSFYRQVQNLFLNLIYIPFDLTDCILHYYCPCSYCKLKSTSVSVIQSFLKEMQLDPYYDPRDNPWRRDVQVSYLINPKRKWLLEIRIAYLGIGTYQLVHLYGYPEPLFQCAKKNCPHLFCSLRGKSLLLDSKIHFELAAKDLCRFCKKFPLTWIPGTINERTQSFKDIWTKENVGIINKPPILIQAS